jgi:hypothetical protein
MFKRVRPSPKTGAVRMWHDVERHVRLVHKGATPPSASVTSLPSRPPPCHGFRVIRATSLSTVTVSHTSSPCPFLPTLSQDVLVA